MSEEMEVLNHLNLHKIDEFAKKWPDIFNRAFEIKETLEARTCIRMNIVALVSNDWIVRMSLKGGFSENNKTLFGCEFHSVYQEEPVRFLYEYINSQP